MNAWRRFKEIMIMGMVCAICRPQRSIVLTLFAWVLLALGALAAYVNVAMLGPGHIKVFESMISNEWRLLLPIALFTASIMLASQVNGLPALTGIAGMILGVYYAEPLATINEATQSSFQLMYSYFVKGVGHITVPPLIPASMLYAKYTMLYTITFIGSLAATITASVITMLQLHFYEKKMPIEVYRQ